jgi:cytidine deaminase
MLFTGCRKRGELALPAVPQQTGQKLGPSFAFSPEIVEAYRLSPVRRGTASTNMTAPAKAATKNRKNRSVPMDSELFQAAKAVRERAHAPYSRFAVGAAVRTAAGTVHSGANVENASYPEGWCAETSAIAHMVAAAAAGADDRRIAAICVVAERIDGRLTTPCGGCRQRIAEFAGPDTPVHVSDPTGDGRTWPLGELLPAAFDLDER